MYFEDDIKKAFKPLTDFLSDNFEEKDIDNTLGQYMYMFHDDEKHHYKHFGSRKYLKVTSEGKAEGKLEDWRMW